MAGTFVQVLGDQAPCAYETVAGAAASLFGIFSNPTTVVDSGSAPVVQRSATLGVQESKLPPGAGQNDRVTVRGRAYVVRALLPDGQGMVELQLEAVS